MNQNAATTIAALLVLNAGLFVSNHARDFRVHAGTRAEMTATKADACKAKMEARAAAIQARVQARQATRDAMRASREAQKEAMKAAMLAPAASSRAQGSVTHFVRCLVNTGVHTMVGTN